jgi:hypothetical protein
MSDPYSGWGPKVKKEPPKPVQNPKKATKPSQEDSGE